MQYWIIKYTQLKKSPTGEKVCDLPVRTLVTDLGETDKNHRKVAFRNFVGWVYVDYLEELHKEYPKGVVEITNATPFPYDADQYIEYNGATQYNLCGELCIAYIGGDALEVFLEKWKQSPNSAYPRVFKSRQARGTTAEELQDMANVYQARSVSITDALRDTLSKQVLISPARIARYLQQGWKYIASVRISGTTGDLQPTGILHWVCVDRVIPDEADKGWVELYNPFPNQRQRYSWKEFKLASGNPYGVLIKL